MGFSTDAIHAGQEPDPSTGAIVTPIFQTSTFVQDGFGVHKGYVYARTSNPTRSVLEKNMAVLERGCSGHAFGSGLAAISGVMDLLRQGDGVVCSENMYGGTYRLFENVLVDHGLRFTYVDSSDPANIESAIAPDTKMVYIETPTNPLMRLTDIGAIAEITRARGLTLVVDNTFMSPYFQNPLELGADIVVHSSTKYLNGHSDVVGGVVVTNDEETAERLAFVQKAVGAVPGPFDCWLVLRGLKTLAVRMREHDRNGREIAAWLEAHPAVETVFYPGLESHPQHDLARRQMRGFGGMISFDVGDMDRAKTVLEGVHVFALAESLGAVESLISHPASMTHASVPKEERLEMGLTDGLLRISVGIEEAEDLIADLEGALKGLEPRR
jgi:cystathionine beta-lyase/cystathionine gamma-synthase